MTHRPRIYLAGPMAGLTIQEADAWRSDLIYGPDADHFEFVSPCRNKESLAGEGTLTHHGYDDHFMCSEHTVFHRDTHDVRSCDGLLVNFLGSKKVSVGTVFEMSLAWELRKPVVAVGLIGSPYDHIFTRQASSATPETMEEGMMVIRSLFNRL